MECVKTVRCAASHLFTEEQQMIIERGEIFVRDVPAYGGGIERQLVELWRCVVEQDSPAGGRWSAWRESVKEREYLP